MPDQLWDIYPYMHLAGRVLFASFAVVFGLSSLVRIGDTAAYLERKAIAGPQPVAAVTGLMLLGGGLLVLLGWHRFIGAGLMFLVLFPGAFALHAFWHEGDPEVRRGEMAQFFLMLGVAGASLLVAFYGGQPWPLSLGR